LISFQKPYKAVSADTVSRWLKKVLELAGIDTKKFGAHSTRSALTSAAKAMDISINTIMESAGWTQESTFVRFYSKPIISKDNFGNSLLQKCRDS
jgi:integrase